MRQDYVKMFHNTMQVFRKGFYKLGGQRIPLKLSAEEREEILVFLPEDIEIIARNKNLKRISDPEDRQEKRVEVGCENADAFSLARKRMKEDNLLLSKEELPVLVLNLANAWYPGGGVKFGARAQEEDLCRKSSLLLSLESNAAKSYYKYNKNLQTEMGSHAVMITPKVEIIKDENGDFLEDSVIVSVMTCAAPCLSGGIEGLSESEYETMVYERIMGMLKVAANLGYQRLILGAFGCGAFDNDAHIVSDLFYKAMKNFDYDEGKLENFFRRIDFAVLDRSENQYNFTEFSRNFNHFYREKE